MNTYIPDNKFMHMQVSIKTFTGIYFCLLCLIVFFFLVFGIDNVLQTIWNTPIMHPYFADIRSITGANETLSLGLDPLIENPGDPWNRTMNYPRVWQHFAEVLNLDHSFGYYFGLANLLLFVTGFLIFTSKIKLSTVTVFVLLIAFFSPASVLTMERGNIDMVIFFLLSLALAYISRPIIFSVIVLFASILKIFPIFAIAGLVKFSKPIFVTLLFITSLVFISYIVITMEDILLMKMGIPQSKLLSYGMSVIPMSAEHILGERIGFLFKVTTYSYILGLSSFTYYFIRKNSSYSLYAASTYIDSFRVGAAIFIFTFIISNNWDYRLIFLIFCIPQLLIWVASEHQLIRVLSFISVTSIVHTMWHLNLSRLNHDIAWVTDELSNWILFSSLLVLFMMSLPSWILGINEKRIIT